MSNNTVKECVAKFLRNKHREEFLANNPWMDITVAAIVFFRLHTAYKLSYCVEYARWYEMIELKWYQIPVSQKQCAGIRADTLARYAGYVAELTA